MVKCIADNAISWIYAPVTKGHLDAEKDDQVIPEEVPDKDMIRIEAAGTGVQSDEIVIDIDNEMEEGPVSSQVSSLSGENPSDSGMDVSKEGEAARKREGTSNFYHERRYRSWDR